ncbi:MAG TPA: DUF1800 domain-containing protein [Fimbriimonas sp.]|nr:DUF1800 domain-containing protein [Fimbriimonas sp.]
MELREKIAHLYRRFGFGARPEDLDRGEEIGLDGVMHRLLDYRSVDENFEVDPHEFAWRTKSDADPSAGSYRLWWAMRMVCGERPAQEQLTLFWHGHFAVSDAKVEDGSMMLQYLNTLRSHADGNFVDLLKAVSKDPAMMRYLDLQRSLVGSPNENFAREVMELFTMGIGNYTEKDVKEAARAFTGWSYVNMYYEFPGTNAKKLKEAMTYNRPFSAFALMPAMHDRSPKTILGKTDFFDGDMFLEHLASSPATARHMCAKLWTYYAYPNPEPALVERLADEWQKSNGNIKHMLFAIARSPEFWSDRCVRKKIKSPADLCVAICRQMGAGKALLDLRGPANVETPMSQQVLNNMYALIDRMARCGLSIFYPTDVSGWKGGDAWVSPAAMVERYGFRGLLVYAQKGIGPCTKHTLEYVKSQSPADSASLAAAVTRLFDIDLPPEGQQVLTQLIDRHGGVKVLNKENVWAYALDRSLLTLMAAPETHVC